MKEALKNSVDKTIQPVDISQPLQSATLTYMVNT